MKTADRHAILAEPSRRAILDVLREAGVPLPVGTIAARVHLHVNSVRDHLHRLRDVGLVRVTVAAPAGRGRPSLLYGLAPTHDAASDPWRAFAAAVADQVAVMPEAAGVWASAGERWGASTASAALEHPGATDTVGTVTAILREAGFEPQVRTQDDGVEIRLHACPFLPVERRHLHAICGVHHGFLQGVLDGLGSPLEASVLEPFAEPHVCIARLTPPPGA